MGNQKTAAEKERLSAQKDIEKDGRCCTLLYDSRIVDAGTGLKTGPDPVSVKTKAVVGSYRSGLVDGVRIQQGDLRLMLADRALAPIALAPLAAFNALDGQAASGYWLYLSPDPQKYAEPIDPPADGDRRLAVVSLDASVFAEGGYPVLRFLQCR